METGEDSHDFKKGDVPVSSRRSSSSTPDSDAYDQQLNVVSSSSSNKDSTTSTAPPLPSHSHPLTTSNLPHLQLQGSLAADGIKETGSSSSRQRIMENHTSSGAPLINQSERHRGCENDSINASKGHCGKNGEGGGNGNHVRSMDYEDADMEVEHEDGRRKRKRDSKETGSGVSEPSSKMTSVVISGITMSLRNHNREKSSSVTPSEERKSPQEARSSPASASSKPLHQNSGSETESTQSDADNETGDGCASGGTHDAPHGLLQKVPPLKIVIPPTSLSEQDRDKSKVANRQALPYVVNASGDMSDSKVDGGCNNGASAISGGVTASDGSAKDDGKSRDGLSGHSEERTHRVTRSSQRMAALASASTSNSVVTLSPLQYATSGGGGGGGGGGNTNSSSSGGNSSGSNSGGATEHGTSVGQDISSGKVKIEPSAEGYSEEQNGPDMHPRKRKLRTREGHSSDANSVGHSSGSASSSWSSSSSHCEDQTILNSYEMYMNIRRQVSRLFLQLQDQCTFFILHDN